MTKYSVKKPFTVLVGVILVLVLGVVSFLGLNTDLLPSLDLPYVIVMTTYPGASPEKVELSVTRPLEQAVATTTGLENMQSISQENMSVLILEFNQSINMDSIMIELSGNIDMVSGYFDSMVSPPMLMKLNPDMMPIQVLSVDVEGMDIFELTQYVDTQLAPYIERISGVATIDMSGGVENFIEIALKQDKIDAINNSILKAIDKDLYNAKVELDNAQSQLNSGITELETKRDDAFAALANASAELDSAQAQTQAIAADKLKYETQLGLLKAQRQIVEAKSSLMQTRTALDSIIAMGMGESTLNDLTLMPGIGSIIQALIDQGLADDNMTVNAFYAQVNAQIAQLDASLVEMGVDPNTSLTDVDTKISQTNENLSQATFMAKQLEETTKQLKETYATLEKTKLSTSTALAVAQSELSSAKVQLETGIKEFESARDSALKQANIDSLVTQSMLSNILTAQNFSMPAGYITDGADNLTVKVGEKFESLESLQNLLLIDMGIDGVAPIYLKDVADVAIKDNSNETYTKINGNDGVILSLQKSSIASTSQVTKDVNKALEELTLANPNVRITSLMDQGVYIGVITNSVMQNLLYGGIIAFFLLLLFLKDLRPTLIIGFSIPISLLFSIVLMYFSGVSLNIISLSGLALGVGMLVDNSIVVIENIYRLRNMGYNAVNAAVAGAKQVGGAIFASTLTTICVFLPIVFTDGISRQLFTDMGLTIAYSLIASLIVAMTVVPAMSANMLTSTKETQGKFFDKIVDVYSNSLSFSLKHKWIVFTVSIALLALSVFNVLRMPMVLIPSMDSTQMTMGLSLPLDTSQEDLISTGEEIAARVRSIDDVETVAIMTSSGGGMMGGPSDSKDLSFYVVLKDNKKLTNEEIGAIIKEQNPEYADTLSISTSNMDMSALGGSGVSVVLKGHDLDILQNTATEIANIISSVDGIATVDDGNNLANNEIRIDIDKTKAMGEGFTVAQVYQLISTALTQSTNSTTLTFDGEDIATVITSEAEYDKDTIQNLVVNTKTDKDGKEQKVLLSEIANIYTATSPAAINRDNQSRTVTISATVNDGENTTLISRNVEKALENFNLPAGYTLEYAGENEAIMSAVNDMILMILLAVIFIYLIMVAQFQSLLSPFIVVFTIPLAFTGGLLALQLTNEPLSITSMIGFLVLSGVVVNNGIVFVDYVNQLRAEGMDKTQALIQAGKDRIRPIMMTALTTILAMSTMAMGVGMGADMSQGMAIVTIGGLSYATLLTLFLVPALYDIMHRKDIKVIDVTIEE